jgi:hypothetical protein
VRTRALLATGVISVLGWLFLPAPPASACPPGTEPQDVGKGVVCVVVVDTGNPGGGTPEGSDPGGGSPVCRHQGTTIPCVTSEGVWFASYECYAQPMTPQPTGNEAGRDLSKGAIWTCIRMLGPLGPFVFYVPDGGSPALADPAVLAERALGSLRLEVPEVGLAPSPPDKSYVGLETWLWMGQNQFRTLTLTVSAGGTSVTVRAVPVQATWVMGDGNTQQCQSAGRPWINGTTDSEQTECSYTYSMVSEPEPGGVFKVSSTITYQVDWTCSGACLSSSGTLGLVEGLPGTATLRVGERQTVVVNP